MKNNNELNQQLFEAAKNNDFELFTQVIKQGGNPEITDQYGFKPAFYFTLGDMNDAECKQIEKLLRNHPDNLRSLRNSGNH